LILDTKYKAPDSPSSSNIHEVRSYAEALGCTEAILAYPIELPNALDVTAGNIRVRSLTFALDGDIEEAGQGFLAALMTSVNTID
jgi:5-methylcytosine-specific restriction enzyme subunit McrC